MNGPQAWFVSSSAPSREITVCVTSFGAISFVLRHWPWCGDCRSDLLRRDFDFQLGRGVTAGLQFRH